MTAKKKISFPPPKLQIDFAFALDRFRRTCLQNALLETVRGMDISEIDKQLAQYVSKDDLATLAQYGLRGELLFAVPVVLEKNPSLLGYYRLLMGYSQKEFYGKNTGAGYFKVMEDKGKLSEAAAANLPYLCKALCDAASELLASVGSLRVSREMLDDLTLLTLGAQLRGGANNQRGLDGIDLVFKIIQEIVEHAAEEVRENVIKVRNASRRLVLIEFSSDPDIIIREEMGPSKYRNVVAIEVKGGTDVSNVHNRIGEAEKSHQKARQKGFTECWTVINVSQLDMAKARSESPSTSHFYLLPNLLMRKGEEYKDFCQRIVSMIGISPPPSCNS